MAGILSVSAADDAEIVAQGARLFEAKICSTCHQVSEGQPALAGMAMKAPKFMGNFWGRERAVTLGFGGKETKVKFDEDYFVESVREPMAKIAKEAAAPMPPPPGVNDAEMRALIAYVRSLGDRSATDGNNLVAKGAIRDFYFRAYSGNWDKLPNFSKLKPYKSGQAKSGIADTMLAGRGNNFGLVFQGHIEIKKKGAYKFRLDSDDGSRLLINGQEIINLDGVHSAQAKTGQINLEPGNARIHLEYFERGGVERLSLDMSGPGIKKLQLARHTSSGNKKPGFPVGNPILVGDETVIYRNFIEGASPRGIAVGYPEKVNLCFDANTMQIALLWHGAFIDGARHWNGRGQGFQPPLGYYRINLHRDQTFAQLESTDAEWPTVHSRDTRAVDIRFRGYQLVENRRPVFRYEIGDALRVEDYSIPHGGPLPSLTRRLTVFGKGKVWYLAAAATEIIAADAGYKVGKSMLRVSFPGLNKEPVLRKNGDRKELLIPLDVEGKAIIQQKYEWDL